VSGTLTSTFGPRWGRMHEGIDIAGASGTPIGAAAGGTVIVAGPSGGYGNLVVVDHGGGLSTAYAHMSSISVSVGQSVGRGATVGGMGTTGNSTGVHLHFEVRAGGVAQNPFNYL
jgi:murein DD-endopeptidase MepM/ murein hydrolase activator NlpD